MNIKNVLETIQNTKKTLLGVGPMSLNCVDSVLYLANLYEVPIQLIASRRQIEASFFGGGYVNSWSTETFSDYVEARNKNKMVFLSRDHGGPWQNYNEVADKLIAEDAMESSKKSFETDIANNFSFIHIDPSIDIHSNTNIETIMSRIFELYEFCTQTAKELNKEIYIEIGTEEQIEGMNTIKEVELNIDKINKFCVENDFSKPTFYVVQNGSKVKETENTGTFKNLDLDNYLNDDALINLHHINKLCLKKGLLPKAHNSDYLSFQASSIYPKIDLKGGNIAPEFGVIETRKIVSLLLKHNLKDELNEFINLSLSSKKWEKWMKKNSKSDDLDKAVISGHYIFSTPKFIELKEVIDHKLKKKKIMLYDEIQDVLKRSIRDYLKAYGWKVD